MSNSLLLMAVLPSIVWAQWAQAPPGATVGFGLHDTTFVVRLLSPLSTRTAREGDTFTASVEEPSQYQGAAMEGRITRLKRPRKGVGKGKAEVQFRFERLTINGRTATITADLKDVKNSQGLNGVDEEGRAIGVASNKKRILSTLVLGGIGAGIGAAAGGAQGAAVGGAAGAAAGLLIGLKMTTTGSDIEFRPGSVFTLSVSDAGRR
jgi:hypothetical protein